MKKLLLLMGVAAALSGCVTDQAYRTYVARGTYPAKSPSQVTVLYTKPVRDFIVIADLQARGNAVSDFREAAADLGADAVIISRLGGNVGNTTWAEGNDGATYSRIVGTAIKYSQGD